MSRQASPLQQIGTVLGEVLLDTGRRAVDAAAQSVIEDARGVATEAVRRLRAALPIDVQQPSSSPPSQRVRYTARVIK
jgi:hypothetical protein